MAQSRSRDTIRTVVADLEELPEERLEQVRDFVESLKATPANHRPGSPAALLDYSGSWEGPKGELDKLVDEIYETRHREEE